MKKGRTASDRVADESIYAYPRLTSPQQLAEACRAWPAFALYTDRGYVEIRTLASLLGGGESLLFLEGAAGAIVGLPPELPGWSRLLAAGQPALQGDALWEQCRPLLRRWGDGDLLPWGGGKSGDAAELLTAASFRTLLETCRERYDRLVLVLPLQGQPWAPPPVCPYIKGALLAPAAADCRQQKLLQQLCEYDILLLGVAEQSAVQAKTVSV